MENGNALPANLNVKKDNSRNPEAERSVPITFDTAAEDGGADGESALSRKQQAISGEDPVKTRSRPSCAAG